MRKLFTRLMAAFLAAILVCSVSLLVVFYAASKNDSRQRSLAILKREGRDLAYLAGRMDFDSLTQSYFGYGQSARRYMEWKLRNLYSEYSSYCIIIDRYGKAKFYIDESLLNDQDIIATLDGEQLSDTMSRVLEGEEVEFFTQTERGTMFTVAIPWMQSERVMGAVMIQTASRAIDAQYTAAIVPILAATLVATGLAAILIFLLTRQIIRPLTDMADAADEMSKGNFAIRVAQRGSEETRQLAAAFNGMAVQLEKLEQSRRDFIANVSHELRSPLTSIRGYLQSMLDGTISPEDYRQYMRVTLDETLRLSKLVSSLLSLSRMEREDVPLNLSVFDLNELARRVIITKETDIESAQIGIETDFGEKPCYVRADRDLIIQVLVNLLDNALKFTPKNGTVRLASRTDRECTYFTVSDDGPGISPEDRPYVFDRFYKADKAHTSGQGTGLGLAICKRIIEKHGQSICLLPSEKGAAFEFTLETAKAPDQQEEPA